MYDNKNNANLIYDATKQKDIRSAQLMYVGCGYVRFTLLTPTNSSPGSK